MRGILMMYSPGPLHFEVLSEDRSGGIILKTVIEKVIAAQTDAPFTVSVRPHRGKGRMLTESEAIPPPLFSSGLRELLPAKLKAYDRVFAGRRIILVIVMDSDDSIPQVLYRQLEDLSTQYAPSLVTVIGICVEEIESWLLGDEDAVTGAYGQAERSVIRSYSQDSVCGTWEVLARAILKDRAENLIRIGYPAVGQYKGEWASRIAPFLDPSRNRSPSFIRFRKILLKKTLALLEKAKNGV